MLMKWQGRNLNTIFPFKIAIIVILIVLPLFAFSYFLVDRFDVRQKLGDLMNLADAKYVHVLDLLDFGKKLNNDRAFSPILRESLSEYEQNRSEQALSEIQKFLTRIKKIGVLQGSHAFGLKPLTKNRYHEVLVTNSEKVVVASTDKKAIGTDLSKTVIFTAKENVNKTYVSDAFRNVDGHTVFAFVSPIFKEENEGVPILGFLITEVNTELLTMIMDADLGNIVGGKLWFAGFQYRSLDLYIINKEGLMITQSRITNKDTVLKQKGSELPLKRGLFGGKGERETIYGIRTGAREAMEIYPNRQGVYVAGASMHIFDEGWTIVVEQETKDAFAGLYQLKIALIASGLIAAFLAGLAVWITSRRITKSLAIMSSTSIKLAGGDAGAQIEVRPGEYNELRVLATSLNLIAQFLKKTTESKKEED